jgi:hypothetical protein
LSGSAIMKQMLVLSVQHRNNITVSNQERQEDRILVLPQGNGKRSVVIHFS